MWGVDLSNILGEPIQPTDECQFFTNAVDGNIDIYNEKSTFQKGIIAYVNTELREICSSPEPDVLECDFDWRQIFDPEFFQIYNSKNMDEPLVADASVVKNLCMPDGQGTSGAGQYVESTFQVTCSNEEGESLTVTNSNVPGCVGRPCSPGQAEFLFDDDYTYVADFFITRGWDCQTEVLEVFAPHYNPFHGPYSMSDVMGPQLIDEPEVIEEESATKEPVDDIDGSLEVGEDISDINSDLADWDGVAPSPSPPPTAGSDLHLRGPNYDHLYKTETPKATQPPQQQDVTLGASSSTARTTTVLKLLLPVALSMILL